jgi:hypothetical protein
MLTLVSLFVCNNSHWNNNHLGLHSSIRVVNNLRYIRVQVNLSIESLLVSKLVLQQVAGNI